MPVVDFRSDVDGFAFKNDWTFNQAERDQIREIIREILPDAAAILTPVLLAISPLVAATASPVIGIIGPFAGLLAPFLPALAPMIAEKLVEGPRGRNSLGSGRGQFVLRDGVRRLGYTRKWVVPRGSQFRIQAELIGHHI